MGTLRFAHSTSTGYGPLGVRGSSRISDLLLKVCQKKQEIQRNWWVLSGFEGTDFFSRSFSRKLICLPSSKLRHCPALWNGWACFASESSFTCPSCPCWLLTTGFWLLITWVAGV